MVKTYSVDFTFDDEQPGDKAALEVLNNETIECALNAFKAGDRRDFTLEDGIRSLLYKTVSKEILRRRRFV